MSDSVQGQTTFNDFGVLGRLITNSQQVHKRLDTLTQQAADGYISDTYAGLGSGATTSLSLSPALAHQQTWQNNIDAAGGRLGVAQNALSAISTIASNFYAQTNNLNNVNPSEVDSVAASARDALRQVAGLLNETSGGLYVFAGQDSGNPPIPSADNILSSGFYQQISTAVGSLGTNGAGATIAATLATAQSNASGVSPFSAGLSQPASALAALAPTIQVGAGQQEKVGILASANGDVVSTGSSTTGSYTRDVLRALATIGSLSSSQVNTAGFGQLVADTHTSLGDAVTALNQDAGVLGDRQTQLKAIKATLGDTSIALQSQLANAQDADTAKTLTQLSATQTQLQASYQLIAGIEGLSLVKFLGASA